MNYIQNPTNLILGLSLALVFALDILTTQICLTNDLGYEMNPFMRAVIENPILTILVKGIALCLIIFFVNYIATKNRNLGYFGMCGAIGITLVAVINNLLVIL